jgi:hypothetical protein
MALEITAERDEASAAVSTSRMDVVSVSPSMAKVTVSGGGGGKKCGLVGFEPLVVLLAARVARRRSRARRSGPVRMVGSQALGGPAKGRE